MTLEPPLTDHRTDGRKWSPLVRAERDDTLQAPYGVRDPRSQPLCATDYCRIEYLSAETASASSSSASPKFAA